MDMVIEKLKNQPNITRQDIAYLLAVIGKPGEKREEKLAAIKQLELVNTQGASVHEDLVDYKEF